MEISEVRSPNNREGMTPNSERRIGVSSLSSPRSDHLGPHVAGKGWTPERLRSAESSSLASDLSRAAEATGNRPLVPKR
jgi:hypothetical protein